MASNPRNLTISGVFLAFPRFFATMRFADTECRKKDIISKKRLRTGFEQLSPAAKAQYPFLRAESAMILRTFCPFFVFLYVKYLCLSERGSSSVTFIKKKIATAATACTAGAGNAVPSVAAAWKIRFARAPPSSMKTTKKSMNSIYTDSGTR